MKKERDGERVRVNFTTMFNLKNQSIVSTFKNIDTI